MLVVFNDFRLLCFVLEDRILLLKYVKIFKLILNLDNLVNDFDLMNGYGFFLNEVRCDMVYNQLFSYVILDRSKLRLVSFNNVEIIVVVMFVKFIVVVVESREVKFEIIVVVILVEVFELSVVVEIGVFRV